MLHPSYTELMERINKDVEEGATPIVQSRYSIVKATADRAKQIIDARSIVDKIAKQIKNDPNAEPVISDSQHLTMKKGSPLIDGNTDDMKPLSIAIEELHKGYVKISERAETDDLPIELQNSEELSDEVAKKKLQHLKQKMIKIYLKMNQQMILMMMKRLKMLLVMTTKLKMILMMTKKSLKMILMMTKKSLKMI